MVKHGLFGLGLVRAETGELYHEHSTTGGEDGIYAEVEPEDEFYLQLRSDAPEVAYADLKVDGILIQKGHKVRPGRESKVGVIQCTAEGGFTNTEVALRFARARVDASGTRETAAAYWTGQVEATFYGNPSCRIPPGSSPTPYSRDGQVQPQPTDSSNNDNRTATVTPVNEVPTVIDVPKVTYTARKTTYYPNTSLASSDVGYVFGKSTESQKKGVKSAEGKTALRQHKWSKREKKKPAKGPDEPKLEDMNSGKSQVVVEKKPEVLGSIVVRYCSTVGLIHAGILDKPPNWDEEQLKSKRTKRGREEDMRILSQVKLDKIELMHERINGRGEKVSEKRMIELFDLTED